MNNNSILTTVFDTYDDIFKKQSDPRVEGWLLFGHPFGYIAVVWTYLFLACAYLPNHMKNRKPYNIQRLIQIYNCCQIIACASTIYTFMSAGCTLKYTLETTDYSNTPRNVAILNLFWYNTGIKLLDLAETTFFILRKKQNQVTLLHLYHHVSSLFFAWSGTQFIAGGIASFTIVLNNFVHIIMYTYYLLSTMGPEVRKKLTFVKSKLTMIQMIQFWMLATHTIVAWKDGGITKSERVFGILNILNLSINFCFFINFYMQSYKKKKTE